jgi:hypothetical protein
MSFSSNTRYPLVDPTRYDDDLGEGYAFAHTVENVDGCTIVDCWIVNEAGEVHPGYDECAVPIRYEDVVDCPMAQLRHLAAQRFGGSRRRG